MDATVNIGNIISKVVMRIGKKNIPNQNDVYSALTTMIEWTRNFKNENEIKLLSQYLTHKEFAKEFCTIKFCLPRRSGHTTFIEKLIGEFNSEGSSTNGVFKKPVLIFPNFGLVRDNKIFNDAMRYGLVSIIDNFDKKKFLGRILDGVIIDCSSTLTPSNIEKIYDTFKHHMVNPNFVFLFLE